jgi:hypothetical protein
MLLVTVFALAGFPVRQKVFWRRGDIFQHKNVLRVKNGGFLLVTGHFCQIFTNNDHIRDISAALLKCLQQKLERRQ